MMGETIKYVLRGGSGRDARSLTRHMDSHADGLAVAAAVCGAIWIQRLEGKPLWYGA